MKEIIVLSGKGGTGKTSITAALASLAKNTVFCDNDVDAADLHLILHPEIKEENVFYSAWQATINTDDCVSCGLCVEYCRFDAISMRESGDYEVNPFKCEGCRLCERVCPESAIQSERSSNNFWYVSHTRFGTMVHAKMGPGEENSGKLVTTIRRRAKQIAKETKADFLLNDGPPGIGCAAISSITGGDLVVLVIEPSKSGLHDASRLVELVNGFKIPMLAIINKYTINTEVGKEIEAYLSANEIPIIAKIPFDTEVVEAMLNGKTIIEHKPDIEISKQLLEAWEEIKKSAVNHERKKL